jgi:4-amino-4-deoxy-L-arabinose transferase-like glycosyltransferase
LTSRRDVVWLLLLAAIFLAWHIPLMAVSPAGQDEDWYGAAGASILKTGIPSVPYIASDDPTSVCHGVNVALYTLPPLGFFAQALVQAVTGPGLAAARLASTLAGLVAAWLVYRLGILWLDDRRAALFGAAVFLFSRFVLFPATSARPDMAAAAFGLGAVFLASHDGGRRPRGALASGACAGASLLSHPFGVVPTAQVGLAIATATDRQLSSRCVRLLAFLATAGGVFALWLPLIALHPDLFVSQFGGNVARRAGPGIFSSATEPALALAARARQLWEYATPPQAVLFLAGTAWGLSRSEGAPGARAFRFHLAAGWLLLVMFEGRHPTLSYYVYPAAFSSLAVGWLASACAGRASKAVGSDRLAVGLTVALLAAVVLPGAGLRTLLAQVRHWGETAYDSHALARAVMADVPAEALTAVDPAYVLDFSLAGRRVVDAFIEPDPSVHLYDVRERPFEFAVFGREGLLKTRPRCPDLILLKTYGDPDDPFAGYLELYRRGPDRSPYSSTPR